MKPAALERFITSKDIASVVPMRDAIALMRSAIRLNAEDMLVSPARIRCDMTYGSLVFTVGARSDIFGVRIYPGNHLSDSGDHITLVYDQHTCKLVGGVIGEELGEWRTGAIGGVAIDAMAPATAEVLGVIGAGRQARTQVLAASKVRRFREIRVYCRSALPRSDFARRITLETETPVQPCHTAREAVADADVIICATNSSQPVISRDWLKQRGRVHINHIGPKLVGATELDIAFIDGAIAIATDAPAQARAMQDTLAFVGPRIHERLEPLSKWLGNDSEQSRLPLSGYTIFASLGLAGTEVILANELLRRTMA